MVKGPPTHSHHARAHPPAGQAITICSVKTGMSGGCLCREAGSGLSPDPFSAWGQRGRPAWWPGPILCQVVDDAGQGLSNEPQCFGLGFLSRPRTSATDFIYLFLLYLFNSRLITLQYNDMNQPQLYMCPHLILNSPPTCFRGQILQTYLFGSGINHPNQE